MTLEQQFLSLPPGEKRRVHLALCDRALAVWLGYTAKKRKIRYTDGVVGLSHVVDLLLPSDAFKAVQEGRGAAKVAERYAEPIIAMQDEDLEFPQNVIFAYYSIYTLFCKYVSGRDIDDWIIVNQALSSEPDEMKIGSMLAQAIKPKIEPGAPADGSQPPGSQANSASSAAGPHR